MLLDLVFKIDDMIRNKNRVPTAPGKPGKITGAFPVMEISCKFKNLKNIMENEKKPGKMRISVIVNAHFSFFKCG